jgi:hypothetical protein
LVPGRHIPIDPAAPDDAYAAIAGDYPVFRIWRATEHSSDETR